MKIQIKNIWNESVMFECDKKTLKLAVEFAVKSGASLYRANLNRANLEGANLEGANLNCASLEGASLNCANLNCANLEGANLYRANLNCANLEGANLYRASLNCANLEGVSLDDAKNIPPIFNHALQLLKSQTGKLRAYKYLKKGLVSPYQNFQYEIGKTYHAEANTDERVLCGAGWNVATLEWCLRETGCNIDDWVYVIVEFRAQDVVVPYNSDDKFRINGDCTIVREVPRKQLEEAVKPLYPSEKELQFGKRPPKQMVENDEVK